MDLETPKRFQSNLKIYHATSYGAAFTLAYQSLGVVYGDMSTSPLYVIKSTFSGKLRLYETEEEIICVLSMILWTFTLIPFCKYIIFVLCADDNGEGGPFALYSLLCRYANIGLLPNDDTSDENIDRYKAEYNSKSRPLASMIKAFFQKHHKRRVILLLLVLFGASMVIGDGVLTPTMSVLSAVSGIKVKFHSLHENYVVAIACAIIVGLFSLQHYGTHRVGFLFAPVIIAWLFCLSSVGIYNIIAWNPSVFRAVSPYYVFKFFKSTGVDGWSSLGGIVLCVTGSEAMFADLGHFSQLSIRVAFTAVVYPCLVLAYMGEAAFLSKNTKFIESSFYNAVPDSAFWPVFVIATLAAVVASQAVISGTFSIIYQCSAFNCFPRVKVIHTSNEIHGQIYIPEINWILMCICLFVTLGFKDTTMIGHAYGLAVTTVMFVTTCLMFLIILIVWQKTLIEGLLFLLPFGTIELLYVSACVIKVPRGGWFPVSLALIVMMIMYVWHYVTFKKFKCDLENKVSIERILDLGPSLGITRVPGIGLIYTDVATGMPALFCHFVANLPAFHQVIVLSCIKCVQVPKIPSEERIVIERIGSKQFRMFRCIVRYGYKDLHQDSYSFENQLVSKLADLIQKESRDNDITINIGSVNNFPDAVENQMRSSLAEIEMQGSTTRCPNRVSPIKDPPPKEKKVRFVVPKSPERAVQKENTELVELFEAKEAGVAYILGHTHVRAKEASSMIKKLAVDIGYSFLQRNCRDTSSYLGIPHTSLLEVGTICYI